MRACGKQGSNEDGNKTQSQEVLRTHQLTVNLDQVSRLPLRRKGTITSRFHADYYVADDVSAREFERKKVRIKPDLHSREREWAKEY